MLNAGGAIVRSVRNSPDEGSCNRYGGGNSRGIGWYNPNNLTITNGNGEGVEATQGRFDTEPDIFNFNVNGYSGKFVFRQNGTVALTTEQDISINPSSFEVFHQERVSKKRMVKTSSPPIFHQSTVCSRAFEKAMWHILQVFPKESYGLTCV